MTNYSYDLFVADLAGEEVTNVTNDPDSEPHHHGWSPDGKRLSWLSERGLELFTDGETEILLTTSDYLIDVYAWSPRSDRLAFVGCRAQTGRRIERDGLYVVEIADRSPTKLLDLHGRSPFAIRWLAKGDTLVWGSVSEGIETLPIPAGGPGGAPQTIFKPNGGQCWGLSVSKDESTVATAVSGYQSVDRYVVWTFGLDGKDTRRLTDTVDVHETGIAWCPSNQNLLASCTRQTRSSSSAVALFRSDIRARFPVDIEELYGPVLAISWSSDGRCIAAECVRQDVHNDSSDIVVLDVATSRWTRLTDSPDVRDFRPVFRP